MTTKKITHKISFVEKLHHLIPPPLHLKERNTHLWSTKPREAARLLLRRASKYLRNRTPLFDFEEKKLAGRIGAPRVNIVAGKQAAARLKSLAIAYLLTGERSSFTSKAFL